jgi:hypothetical protein
MRKAMPKFPTILAAGPLALLLLSGAASATPGEGQTVPAAQDGQIEVAHYGDPATAEPQPQNPERFVRIAGFVWSKTVGAMQANLTIESTLPFALKEVELACAQFARTGVEIGTNHRTIEEIVPARGRLRVEALEIGAINPDAGSTGCRVVSVTPA